MSVPKLNLVVAACNNNGIGINGNLPWRLRKDMDFFKMITMTTSHPEKQNAVIMGRKTWFSIPEKFRPLRNRVNIVLSREMKEVPEGVHIARSLLDAISIVQMPELENKIEDIHIIGGSSVYKEVMCDYPCRLYLTRILGDYDCDTFLPEIDNEQFTKVANPENVPEELQEEKGVKFRFEVYDKVTPIPVDGPIKSLDTPINQPIKSMDSGDGTIKSMHEENRPIKSSETSNGPMEAKLTENQPIKSSETSNGPMESKITENGPIKSMDTCRKDANEPIKFDLIAAMCDGNRGIGYEMKLPWPHLKTDFQYYRSLSSTRRNGPSGMVIQIHGRNSWGCCTEDHRSATNVYHIVVSRTMNPTTDAHPHLIYIGPTFQAAYDYCMEHRANIDSIWIMGGIGIYKEALAHPQCNRIYLTHVYRDFPVDAIFPPFEHMFKEIKNDAIQPTQHEDNGIKFEFKLYQKI